MKPLDNETIDACAKQVDDVMKRHIDNANKVSVKPHDQATIIAFMLKALNMDIQNHLQALKTEENVHE